MSRLTDKTLKRWLRGVDGWEHVPDKEMTLTPLLGSMTNHVYKCCAVGSKSVLMRVYGATGGLFDRRRDVENFKLVDSVGLAPKLLGMFEGGRIEQFLDEFKTLKSWEMRRNQTSQGIARTLAEFHFLTALLSDKKSRLKPILIWDRLWDWHRLAMDVNPELVRQLSPTARVTRLETALKKIPEDVCFCHFDLQHGNIMQHRTKGDVCFIDYEYACVAGAAFDIANHWCEWCADYEADQPHVLHPENFPTIQQQQDFIRCYLTSLPQSTCHPQVKGKHSEDALDSIGHLSVHALPRVMQGVLQSEIPDSVVEAFRMRVLAYVPLSHMMWMLWSIVQDAQSDVDFDFRGYAQQRFSLYASCQ